MIPPRIGRGKRDPLDTIYEARPPSFGAHCAPRNDPIWYLRYLLVSLLRRPIRSARRRAWPEVQPQLTAAICASTGPFLCFASASCHRHKTRGGRGKGGGEAPFGSAGCLTSSQSPAST